MICGCLDAEPLLAVGDESLTLAISAFLLSTITFILDFVTVGLVIEFNNFSLFLNILSNAFSNASYLSLGATPLSIIFQLTCSNIERQMLSSTFKFSILRGISYLAIISTATTIA
ncbi:Uncharacterised protein [Staphylococcus aureus]|nr:Uncharacterised protein [Staphylococcus aureus]